VTSVATAQPGDAVAVHLRPPRRSAQRRSGGAPVRCPGPAELRKTTVPERAPATPQVGDAWHWVVKESEPKVSAAQLLRGDDGRVNRLISRPPRSSSSLNRKPLRRPRRTSSSRGTRNPLR
jgi:hypothetical protein